jgi:hypothetical protein
MPWTGNALAQTDRLVLVNTNLVSSGPASGVDIGGHIGLMAFELAVPLVVGTTPSLTMSIETSDLLASGYTTATRTDATAATFAARTTAGTDRLICDVGVLRRFVRANAVITGTAPGFATAITATALRQTQ